MGYGLTARYTLPARRAAIPSAARGKAYQNGRVSPEKQDLLARLPGYYRKGNFR